MHWCTSEAHGHTCVRQVVKVSALYPHRLAGCSRIRLHAGQVHVHDGHGKGVPSLAGAHVVDLRHSRASDGGEEAGLGVNSRIVA